MESNGHRRGFLLVVDDEPTITDVLARYLERAGYETQVAADGPQALALAATRRPDLRRVDLAPEHEEPLEFGVLHIEPETRRAFVRGEEAALTLREFDLLLFLARHPGRVFSREQLMDAVWQYAFYTDTSTVTVHIRRLRAKIERDPARPEKVQTVWGVGYRFQP